MTLGIRPNITFASTANQRLMVDEAQSAIRRLNVATAKLNIHTVASSEHRKIDSKILNNLLNLIRR